MRQGDFEILLLDSSNNLIEEKIVDNKIYGVGEPGSEYSVVVKMYRNTNGEFPVKSVRVGLYVDGVDVQYWKRLDTTDPSKTPAEMNLPVTATFWGFKKSNNDIRAFVFTAPKTASNEYGDEPAVELNLGNIKAEIFECRPVGGVFDNKSGCYEVPYAHSVQEGQKFWKQASLGTTGGRQLANIEKFSPLIRWENVTDKPCEVIHYQYHSAGVLMALTNIADSADTASSDQADSSKRMRSEGVDLGSQAKRQVTVDLCDDTPKPSDDTTADEDVVLQQNIQEVSVSTEVAVVDLCDDDEVSGTMSYVTKETTHVVQQL